MRWSERQQAMLREMGIRLWLPPDGASTAEAESAVATAEPPASQHAFEPPAALESAPAHADWMVVIDAPDADAREGELFSGPAGQLLDNMLRAVGRTRGSGPPERRVHAVHAGALADVGDAAAHTPPLERREVLLRRRIELVRPRLVIALGRGAAQRLLDTEEPFGRLRGRVHRWQELPLIVTYAPAYLLRHPQDKAGAWDDLCLALETVTESSPG